MWRRLFIVVLQVGIRPLYACGALVHDVDGGGTKAD